MYASRPDDYTELGHLAIMSSIGPTLPPHLQKARQKSLGESLGGQESAGPRASPTNEELEEEGDFGPALPPHLLAKRKIAVAGPSLSPARHGSPSSAKKTVGPTLPPNVAAQRGYESESDEDVGPSIHMASKDQSEGDGVREFLEREARIAKEREVSISAQVSRFVVTD